MADEKKPTTKKADGAKAADEKTKAKKAAKKDDAKAAKAKESKDTKKAGSAKKEPKAKKEAKGKEAKKAMARDKGKKADAKGKDKGSKAKKEPAKGTEKPKVKGPTAPPIVKASARYVRVAPRKARLIADQVRGMHIESARALLQFSPRGAAHPIHKLINSAAANAENNHDLIGDEMRIASITVDEGPTLRRYRPRAMGRATPINKRTSHIRVALTPAED
jgi:ribosomal protein L22